MASNNIQFDSTKNPVSAVTVFLSNRADVRREVKVDLKVGGTPYPKTSR
jgi:hypothetical protein